MSKQERVRGRGERSGRAPRADADAPFVVDDVLGDAGSTGAGPRLLRLERLIFEELDRLFRLEVSDPRLSDIAIARVQLSPDLRNAKVYYARRDASPQRPSGMSPGAARVLLETQQKTINDGLLRVTPFLRARLADIVMMKQLPDLHFHRDRDAEAALRATQISVGAEPSSR
ncbi:MAG: ribosome-binding factor A [Myxococcales bacterium]|nr:ribosome-binding factor A [Myxococcales bacterium]